MAPPGAGAGTLFTGYAATAAPHLLFFEHINFLHALCHLLLPCSMKVLECFINYNGQNRFYTWRMFTIVYLKFIKINCAF